MSDPIDPVDFGRLIATVEHLSNQLTAAQSAMDALSKRLGEVEDRYKVGKAAVFGAILVLAFAVLGVKEVFSRVLGALTP